MGTIDRLNKGTTMAIYLPQIYPVAHPEHYKLHLACWNGKVEPLEEFVRDPAEWESWNSWWRTRDDFSRDFIFALIDFYPEDERWLFGGAYRVLSRRRNKGNKIGYRIELLDESKPFIGRLKLWHKRRGRNKALYFEDHYDKLIVSEIGGALDFS